MSTHFNRNRPCKKNAKDNRIIPHPEKLATRAARRRRDKFIDLGR
jgi:hypothetical protein